MKIKLILLTTFVGIAVACNPDSGTPDVSIPTTTTCTYSGTLSYDIGQDITQDFTEVNVTATNEVSASSCSDIPVGSIANTNTDSVERAGNTFTVTANGSADTLTVASGTTLNNPPDETASANGITITIKISSATLDTINDDIVLVYSATVTRPIGTYLFENGISSKKQFVNDIILR